MGLTQVSVRAAGPPINRGYIVTWKRPNMPVPAFWHFETAREAWDAAQELHKGHRGRGRRGSSLLYKVTMVYDLGMEGKRTFAVRRYADYPGQAYDRARMHVRRMLGYGPELCESHETAEMPGFDEPGTVELVAATGPRSTAAAGVAVVSYPETPD